MNKSYAAALLVAILPLSTAAAAAPTAMAAAETAVEPAAAPAAERQVLPSSFEHNRIILTPAVDGRVLRFYTDTGGGFNAVTGAVVEALSLPTEEVTADGQTMRMAPFPDFDTGASIPPPPPYFMDGRLAVADPAMLKGLDGFLGGRWHADRILELDYPAKRIAVLSAVGDSPGTCVPLGFQEQDGQRTTHFPSIDVSVDGEVLPMLFDTGAMATTTDTSAPVFGVLPGDAIGASFIEHAVFERWRQANPDWRVLDAADAVGPQPRQMIEVPEVTIAGHTVGPVWFAERPEGAFQQWMSSMMDRPVWGALGGSGLRHFRVVLDYPGSQACFRRPG